IQELYFHFFNQKVHQQNKPALFPPLLFFSTHGPLWLYMENLNLISKTIGKSYCLTNKDI
ncbi:uncharacterized protein METZ01_LOCUS142639, partial [marine metagenome]